MPGYTIHIATAKQYDRFYYDYDCLNKELIEDYNIEIFENIKLFMNFYNEKPKYLKKSKLIDFIEQIANMDIQEKVEIIKQKGMEGL